MLAACARDAAIDYGRPQSVAVLKDGRLINYFCRGENANREAPTVIFEAGLADSTYVWREVLPRVAAKMRACAYDRAGFGFSDPGPLPRDTAHQAADLDAWLAAAKIAPPYILVAHSLGSLPARAYAREHLDAVSGIVLLDPSFEGQDRAFAAEDPHYAEEASAQRGRFLPCLAASARGELQVDDETYRGCDGPLDPKLPASMRAAVGRLTTSPGYWRALLSELDSLTASTPEADGETLGDTPLIVLTASDPKAPTKTDGPWYLGHEKLTRQSRRGRHEMVSPSSHYVQLDQPQRVVSAIEAVAAESGRTRK